MRFFRVIGRICAVLMALHVPLAAQRGAIVAPRALDELSAQSATIIRGHVVSARVEPHPQYRNLHTVVVSLRVAETLKGAPGANFTFRQFIWDIRDRYDAAGYRKGQELLLIMNPPTASGFSAPAGLEQGRFRIQRDAEGRATAVNGQGNHGLFRNMKTRAGQKGARLSRRATTLIEQHEQGPVPLEDLRELIRQFAEAN